MAEENHKIYLPLEHLNLGKEETKRLTVLCRQGKLDARLIGKRWHLAQGEVDYARELARGFVFPEFLPNAKAAALVVLLLGGGWAAAQGMKSVASERVPSARVGPEMLVAAAEPVFTKVTMSLADLYQEWQDLRRFVYSQAFYYSYRLRMAWSNFGGGSKPETAPVTAITLNPETPSGSLDKETLKAEIKRELVAEIERVSAGVQTGGGNNQGLVVFPATGDPAKDALTQEIIKEAFSSEVQLQVDSSGRAGIITPVFQDSASGNYLFLITPIRTGP